MTTPFPLMAGTASVSRLAAGHGARALRKRKGPLFPAARSSREPRLVMGTDSAMETSRETQLDQTVQLSKLYFLLPPIHEMNVDARAKAGIRPKRRPPGAAVEGAELNALLGRPRRLRRAQEYV